VTPPLNPPRRREALLLFGLWLAGLLLDLAWVRQHQLPPAWDQGDHLSRALGSWQVLQQIHPLSGGWWHELWAQAPSYRGPLTYLVTAPLFSLLGPGYRTAILSNSLFQALLLASLYGQGCLAGKRSAGLWAAFLAAVAPALLHQRTDYLIDFSLTSVLTACWLLMGWRHLGQPRWPWLASAGAGVGLGLVMLTRATGPLLLWLPLVWLLGRALGSLLRGRWVLLGQALLAAGLAWVVAGGWFSQNWLTIVSTVNNARRWGVLYQEGLEANTLAGWLYYPRLLPTMAGAWLVGLVLVGWLLSCWRRHGWPRLPATAERRWRLAWWLSFPLGALLLATLMSTKDFRFVLPLLPQLLLGLGLLISASGRWLQGAVVVLGLSGVLACQFGLGPNLTGFATHTPRRDGHWPVPEIVAAIRRQSPQQLSTLAVLPDSEFLNAFNLEAEGRRQQFRVAARQTLAPLEHLDDDLAGFDWFLLKGGDQGVMSDERQARLSELVRRSAAFQAVARWPLPDGSQAELFRRRQLSLEVEDSPCPAGRRPQLELWPAAGLTRLRGAAADLVGGQLLLTGQDHAVGQGMVRPLGHASSAGCLAITERLQPADGSGNAQTGTPTADLLTAAGPVRPLAVTVHREVSEAGGPPPPPAMASRHPQLLDLGGLLRRGELDELFQRVGRINQHDPEQLYLADGETILRARLTHDPDNLDLLYPLALAQALQRKAAAAAVTLHRITRLDPTNPSAHLGLGFVQLYRFKPWAAQSALDQAALLNPSNPTLHPLRVAAAALRLDLAEAHALLTR
jgi:4-amino-4-deoxy-L-arabinose transferase-like glycosyltransferase